MKIGQATGLQIAFLMFAVMLLAVPVSDAVVKAAALNGPWKTLAEGGTQFALACLVIVSFPRLRRFARQALLTPIPPPMRSEVALVAIAKLTLAFATAAGIAFWLWLTEGSAGVDQMLVSSDREVANAYSARGLARLVLTVLLGPIVEELVFRGFIYRAFERQWGWLGSMLATSVLFGLYHSHFWSAFFSSIVFVCAVRRTGSLWAPIAIHMVFNLMLWWPLLGQHVFPHGGVLSELSTWRFHIACFAFGMVTLPIYVWMSRDRATIAPTVMLEPHGALSK